MRSTLIAAILASLLPALAVAQTGGGGDAKPQTELQNSRFKSAPPAAAAPASPTAAKPVIQTPDEPVPAPHPCKQPAVPKSFGSQTEADEFNANLVSYHDCIEIYVNVQKKAADQHVTAANGAAGELNTFVKEVNEKLVKKN